MLLILICTRCVQIVCNEKTTMTTYSKDGITIATMLDTRRELANGTYPIKIRVTYKRVRKYYPTGKSLTSHSWEVLPTSKTKELSSIRKDIENSFDLVREAVEELAYSGEFSFERLDALLSHPTSLYVNDLYEDMIAEMKNKGQVGTAGVYRVSLNDIEGYRGRVPLSSITPRWLEGLMGYQLDRGLSTTSIAIRHRALRAVLNEAIRRNLMRQSDYPFGRGKFEIQESVGRKLALTIEQIGQIARYDDGNEATRMYRDYWLFIYLCNGINVSDFISLKYRDIVNNEIRFVRKKTAKTSRVRKEIVVVVTEQMQTIIDRWGNHPAPNAYIIPHLKGNESPEEFRTMAQYMTRFINKRMKRIGKELGFGNVTTYTARHSFATVLKRAGANIAYISESLGHTDLKTTEHYLASFEREEREKNAALLTQW